MANGTGDDLGREGYTGRLRELLAPRGWEVLNQSRGGDNTKTMAPRFAPEGTPDPKVRYLLTVNPGYVLLGLSLGNEGIQNGTTKAEKDAIYAPVRSGHARVRRAQPRASHRADHHAVLHAQRLHGGRVRVHAPHEPRDQRVGRAERQLPRRGGRWHGEVGEGILARLAASERRGPRELCETFVPTLFDALEQGKPAPARMRPRPASRASTARRDGAQLHAGRLDAPVRVRRDRSSARATGASPASAASTLTAAMAMKTRRARRRPRRAGVRDDDADDARRRSLATIGVQNGVWVYTAANGSRVALGREGRRAVRITWS